MIDGGSDLFVAVEARGDLPLACQNKTSPETADLDGMELAELPMILADSYDMLSEIMYFGKATMKGTFLENL